jgi:hypothetical protein
MQQAVIETIQWYAKMHAKMQLRQPVRQRVEAILLGLDVLALLLAITMTAPALDTGGLRVLWAPFPGMQTAACSAAEDEVLVGGAKGPGKTDIVIASSRGRSRTAATRRTSPARPARSSPR